MEFNHDKRACYWNSNRKICSYIVTIHAINLSLFIQLLNDISWDYPLSLVSEDLSNEPQQNTPCPLISKHIQYTTGDSTCNISLNNSSENSRYSWNLKRLPQRLSPIKSQIVKNVVNSSTIFGFEKL